VSYRRGFVGKAALGAALLAGAASAPVFAQETAAASTAAGAGVLELLWWIAPIGAIAGLIFAFVFYKLAMSASEGNDRMKEIAGYVREGAYAYLFRQYKVVALVFVLLIALFTGLAFAGLMNPFMPVGFLTGGLFSAICGFIGMKTATQASSRTAQGCSESLNRGLQVAFRSGAVMGLVVVGMGLLNIAAWYLILDHVYSNNVFGLSESLARKLGLLAAGTPWSESLLQNPGYVHGRLVEITSTMITFGMGASTQALFARVGGGIYTKAADVGADLVGKVEAGIPEDDPRNPATIADNVGDNVGDIAGMGADLYESYCNSILATSALGAAIPALGLAGVLSPMIVAGVGIVLSIIGVFLVRTKEGATQKNLLQALLLGTGSSSVLVLAALAALAYLGVMSWGVFGAIVVGLAAGVIIGQATEYYTADEYGPVRGIAEQANMGPATAIIDGLSIGFLSTGIPVLTIVVGIILSFGLAGGFTDMSTGLYGVAFAAVGMLSTLGVTLATDAYGPIADNAGGNAEMSGLPPEVRERTDALDALGNTTAATGKGFAIGSAALTALALLVAFGEAVKVWIGNIASASPDKLFRVGETAFCVAADKAAELSAGGADAVVIANAKIADLVRAYDLSIVNPKIIGGIFIGAMMAAIFCALTMRAVGRAAGAMVEEVRRQFREIPGIMEGEAKPDYASCVAISTTGAQKEMVVPSLLAIIVPVVVGVVLGVPGVMGLLAGGLTAGFVMAVTLNNAGGAWDNAKKYIEKGHHGGKGSDAHKAAVVCDTVGDPFKDTSGPSLNILIKLMSMVAVVFAGLIVKLAPIVAELLGMTG